MNFFKPFVRAFYAMICLLIFTTYAVTLLPGGISPINITAGVIGGLLFSLALLGLEFSLKGTNLRSFNSLALGLFCGCIMSQAVLFLLNSAFSQIGHFLLPEVHAALQIAVLLASTYFAVILTLGASEEFYLAIPFVKLNAVSQKKRDFLVDISVLLDTRIIDLANSSLLDGHLIVPRFIVKELQSMSEHGDEGEKARARKGLESIKKLENLPSLELQFCDTDFPEYKDLSVKLYKLAAYLNANVITADSRLQQGANPNETKTVNINALANALKPITQNGEYLTIKIQRYGKEPRQGIGYLDDGTMVVVNGGAEYIGDTIKAQVLSAKHTSSGRMIFCNTIEEYLLSEQNMMSPLDDVESTAMAKNYFTL